MNNRLFFTSTLFLCFALLAARASAQDCTPAQYQKMLKEADQAVKKGEYDLAINKLQSAKVCQPGKEGEVSERMLQVFREVNKQRELAIINAEEAKRQQKAAIANAETARQQRDSARAEALRNYANDLAYKSQTALRDGDRNAAFRLAESAFRYVDADNPAVIKSMIEALYRNDRADLTDKLPRHLCLEGHPGSVFCLAFSPDGKRLATGSGAFPDQNLIKIWDLEKGAFVAAFECDIFPISSIAFSPDGKRIATGEWDKTAKIRDAESGKILFVFEGHSDIVESVAFSPDGKKLATGSLDNKVKVWDIESGNLLRTLTGHSEYVLHVAFSPDGKYLATASRDRTAKIWNPATGQLIASLEGHSDDVNDVAFSPDGKTIATASRDQTSKLWEMAGARPFMTLDGHSAPLHGLVFSPDGKKLATCSSDKTAKIWDLKTGKNQYTCVGHVDAVMSIAFSPDGRQIATGSMDKTARIWNLDFKESAITLEDRPAKENNRGLSMKGVAFSPDGKRLATCSSEKTITIRDASNDKVLATLEGHSNGVNGIVFSPDGKHLASASVDKTVKIWDMDQFRLVTTFEGHQGEVNGVAFSPDGKKLASVSVDQTVKIWDMDQFKPLTTLNGFTSLINSVAFSPDGKKLAAGGGFGFNDNTAKIWDVESGKIILTLGSTSDEYGRSAVMSIAFSPDGNKLATGFRDGTTKAWDIEKGKALFTLQSQMDAVTSVSFSPEGKRLAICLDNTANSDEPGEIIADLYGKTIVCDAETGKILFDLRGHGDAVNGVAFSPRGNQLATASSDGTVKIWEVQGDGLIDRWKSTGPVSALTPLQLRQFNLEGLLDQKPGNEERLIATQEHWQIANYAELIASQSEGSDLFEKAKPKIDRADRLYKAALKNISNEPVLYKNSIDLLKHLSEINRENGNVKKAEESEDILFQRVLNLPVYEMLQYVDYFEKKGKKEQSALIFREALKKECPPQVQILLYETAEELGVDFDFKRLENSENIFELIQYGNHFFEKSEGDPDLMDKSRRFYEKSERIKHSPHALIALYEIALKTGEPFNAGQFLESKNAWELREYADYFYEKTTDAYEESGDSKKLLNQATLLYEKAEKTEHSAETLIRLYEIAEANRKSFDLQQFMAPTDTNELKYYMQYFLKKAEGKESPREKAPDSKVVADIGEKWLLLHNTAASRQSLADQYNNLAFYQLFVPDGKAAEAGIRRCMELDPSNKYAPTNLAPALLLQEKYKDAKAEYLKWKDKAFDPKNGLPAYKDAFLADLDDLENSGVKIPFVEEIRALLSQ